MPEEGTRPAHAPSWVATLFLAGAVLLWGMSFVATKTALNGGFSPMTVVWLRMVVAVAVLSPFWSHLPKPDYRRGDIGWLVLVCLLQPGVYYLCENYAIGLTTSSQAGVISAIVPLLVAAGAWLFLREHISGRTIGGIGLSVAGVVALSLGASAATSAPNPIVGNTLEVIAMISAAGSMIAIKHLVRRYDPWVLTGIQSAAGAVFFLPGALASNPATWLSVRSDAWIAIAYLGGFVSLAAFGLYAMALKRLPASQASIAINAVPLVALASGWVALHESLSLLQGVGCLAIAAGVALGQSGAAEQPGAEEGIAEAESAATAAFQVDGASDEN